MENNNIINITFNLNKEKYPILKNIKYNELEEFIKKIFDCGYSTLFPNYDKTELNKNNIENIFRKEILNEINYLRDDITDMDVTNKIESLSSILETFLGLSNNSNKKGKISEDLIYSIFQSKYKDLSYEKTRHIPHSGDGILIFPNKMKALVEIKNYTSCVKKEEIDKFKYDMKYNNTYYGLFISLNSSIQGQSQLSFEKMIHNNQEYNIVYVSHIDNETVKLDAALLVLEKLYELKSDKKNNIDWIQEQINNHFKEFVSISKKTSFLKDSYVNMENSIKNSLNDYYKILRDYQYDLDNKINLIWTKMNDDFNLASQILIQKDIYSNILETFKDDKCFYILTKIFDILINNNIILEINDTKNWKLIFKNKEIGEIKKGLSKIDIKLFEPFIVLTFAKSKENDIEKNFKLLNIILSNI